MSPLTNEIAKLRRRIVTLEREAEHTPRELGCQCTREHGDSPCSRVHDMTDEQRRDLLGAAQAWRALSDVEREACALCLCTTHYVSTEAWDDRQSRTTRSNAAAVALALLDAAAKGGEQ